jgi:hypothetical protein
LRSLPEKTKRFTNASEKEISASELKLKVPNCFGKITSKNKTENLKTQNLLNRLKQI